MSSEQDRGLTPPPGTTTATATIGPDTDSHIATTTPEPSPIPQPPLRPNDSNRGDAQGPLSSSWRYLSEAPNHDYHQSTRPHPHSVHSSVSSSSLSSSSSLTHEQHFSQLDNRQYPTSLFYEPQLQHAIHSPPVNTSNTGDTTLEHAIGGHDQPRAVSISIDHPLFPAVQSAVFASESSDPHFHSIEVSSLSSTQSPHFAPHTFPSGPLTASLSHSDIACYHTGNHVSMANPIPTIASTPTSPSRRLRHGISVAQHPLMRVDTSSTASYSEQRQPSPLHSPSPQQTHTPPSQGSRPGSSRFVIPQLNLSGRELFEGTPLPTETTPISFAHHRCQNEGVHAGRESSTELERPIIISRGRSQHCSSLSPAVDASQWPAAARLHRPESLGCLGSSPSQIAIEINTPMGTRWPLGDEDMERAPSSLRNQSVSRKRRSSMSQNHARGHSVDNSNSDIERHSGLIRKTATRTSDHQPDNPMNTRPSFSPPVSNGALIQLNDTSTIVNIPDRDLSNGSSTDTRQTNERSPELSIHNMFSFSFSSIKTGLLSRLFGSQPFSAPGSSHPSLPNSSQNLTESKEDGISVNNNTATNNISNTTVATPFDASRPRMVSNTSFTFNHEQAAQDLSRNMASPRVSTSPSGGILSNLLRLHALSNPPPSSSHHHRRRHRRHQSHKPRKTVRKSSSIVSDIIGASSSRYKLTSRNTSVISLPGLVMAAPSVVGLTPHRASSTPPVAPSPNTSTLLGSPAANNLAQIQPPVHPFDGPTSQHLYTHSAESSTIVSPTSPRAGVSLAPDTYLHSHYARRLSNLLPLSGRSSISADDDASLYSSSISLDPATTALRLQQQRELTAALADILQRQDLLIRLCKSFIRYGAPSHRIELAMEAMCRTFGVSGSFAFLPGLMMISFGDADTHTSETHLIKCAQGFDMGRLAKVHKIARAVVYNQMDPHEALMSLKLVNAEKSPYGVWVMLASYAMCSGLIAPLVFKGSWYDMVAGMGLGLVVGLTSLLASRYSVYSDVFEVSTSIVIAFVAKALRDYVCFTGLVLSGIVILLPGLSLTTAIMELSSRYMISGSVRMFYSLIYCLFLGFGLSIGSNLWDVFREPPPGDLKLGYCHPATEPWRWVLFPLLAIAFNIQLNAQPRQWPVMVVCSSVGYAVSEFAGMYWPHSLHIAAAVSAFVVGLLGNLYERLTHELAFVPILGAILLIVPGGMGVRSSLLLLDQSGHASQGTAFALQMIVVALGIAVGLFASTLVVYPLGKKRNALLTF